MGRGVPGVGFLRLRQSLALEDHGGNDLERLHPFVRLAPRDQLQNNHAPRVSRTFTKDCGEQV